MAKFGIGQAVRRVEDQRFLMGQGRYVDDISLPMLAHGVTVLSPHANARIMRYRDLPSTQPQPRPMRGTISVTTDFMTLPASRSSFARPHR